MKISRRTWTLAATVAGVGVVAEAAALSGIFDHRATVKVADGSFWRSTFTRMDRMGEHVNGVGHIGHSTYVVVVKGVRVMTDPWFFDPAFGSWAHQPGVATLPEEVGPLDVIAISHEHPDHFDPQGIDRLDKTAQVLVPTEALKRRVLALGYAAVHVLKPWDKIQVRAATITALPAVHDVEEVGYAVTSQYPEHGVYFAADTALSPAMAEIAERIKPRLAILPVAGNQVRWRRRWVMDVEDALSATRILKVKKVIPSHAEIKQTDWFARRFWFRQTEDAREQFARRIARELKEVICYIPKIGDFVRT